MLGERYLFDFLIYLDIMALLFIFGYLNRFNQRIERIAYYLFIAIWIMLTVYLVHSLSVQFDPLLFYTWIIISFSLVLHYFNRVDLFVFSTNLLGLIMLIIYRFVIPHSDQIYEQMILSELIYIHVTMAWISYAAFSLAGVCAMLYLCNHYLLKQKNWFLVFKRFPSLDRLQWLIGWLILIGVWLLSIALVLGVLWGMQTLADRLWMDVKIWSSVIMLTLYRFILYQWRRKKWRGTRVAWWCLGAMVCMVMNYFVSHLSHSFHQWL